MSDDAVDFETWEKIKKGTAGKTGNSLNLDTGWHPTIEEYHALAADGVISSSMLLDLVPPAGRPRVFRDFWIDQSRVKGLVGVDAWRGTIVDSVLTEGGSVEYFVDLGCRGFADAAGKVVAVIPPMLDLRKKADKEKWFAWQVACEKQGLALIGLSTDRDGKQRRQLTQANELIDQVGAISDFIQEGRTPAAELARELLQGESGVSQLSHKFTWRDIKCRWRPDRIVEIDDGEWLETKPAFFSSTSKSMASYAQVSLKITKDAHPGPFWANYQKAGWGMRDAFYELGWSRLSDSAPIDGWGFPWYPGRTEGEKQALAQGGYDSVPPEGYDSVPPEWGYREEDEPIDWIVVAAHHLPTPEVFVHIVPESQRRLGRKRCAEALMLLKTCMDTDTWDLPEERGAQLGRDPRPWEWES